MTHHKRPTERKAEEDCGLFRRRRCDQAMADRRSILSACSVAASPIWFALPLWKLPNWVARRQRQVSRGRIHEAASIFFVSNRKATTQVKK